MPEEPAIPSRNATWETPFSPVAPVNAAADATHRVGTYSSGRRVVAIALTIAAVALVAVMVATVVAQTPDATGPDGEPDGTRALFVLHYRDVVIWAGICAAVVWGVWRWANQQIKIP